MTDVYRQLVVKVELSPDDAERLNAQVLRGHSVITEPNEEVVAEIRRRFPHLHYWRLAGWECGGGFTHTGSAQIVCAPNGEPLKPAVIRRRGHLACGYHALFVGQWFVVINARHHRRDFSFVVEEYMINDSRIGTLDKKILWRFEEGDAYIGDFEQWFEQNVPSYIRGFKNALKAAYEKALCYHCRSPHYIKQ